MLPEPCVDHLRQNFTRQLKDAAHIDVESLVPYGIFHFVNRPAAENPGIVDENVHLAELLCRGFYQTFRILFRVMSPLNSEYGIADFFLRLVETILSPAKNRDARAFLCEQPGAGQADARCPSRDNGGFILGVA